MIIEWGKEDGLDDTVILKRLQQKIIGLPLKRAQAYFVQLHETDHSGIASLPLSDSPVYMKPIIQVLQSLP